MRVVGKIHGLLTITLLVLVSRPASAGEVTVAVASNFFATAQELATEFEKNSLHTVILSPGSTGKHTSQIIHGAPYDLFLAADSDSPKTLIRRGHGLANSLKTYAVGKLVFLQPNAESQKDVIKFLREGDGFIALANPKLAPYGRAAQEVLQNLGIWNALQGRLIMGENVSQALQYVGSGNATLGLVAAAQVQRLDTNLKSKAWVVPANLYSKINQSMLLINATPASQAFYHYLLSASAQHIIRSSGFGVAG